MIICPVCQKKDIKFFHKIDKYSYYKCNNCVTLFLHPKPTYNKTRTYYEKDFDYTAGSNREQYIRKRAADIWKKLRQLNPAGKTLLDVGSGYGYLLNELRKTGLETIGIEPSENLYDYSKKMLKLDVIKTSFENYDNKRKKFDFITVIHVIEHVTKPQDIIKKALSLLNEGGVLFVETPNLDSHLFNFELKNYTFLTPPDHMYLFSLKSFLALFNKLHGVEIEIVSTYSYPEHFMGILKTLVKGKKTQKPAIYSNRQTQKISKLKIILFDKLLANFFLPVMNLYNKGSILEIYFKKSNTSKV